MELMDIIDTMEAKQKELVSLNEQLEKWNRVATGDAYKARIKILNDMKNTIKEIEKISEWIEKY